MSAGAYEIWLTDDYGLRLALLDYTLGFSATRDTDAIGYLTINLPASFDESLIKAGFVPEYVAIRETVTLLPPTSNSKPMLVLIAAKLGDVRLIDNIRV